MTEETSILGTSFEQSELLGPWLCQTEHNACATGSEMPTGLCRFPATGPEPRAFMLTQ